MVVNETPLSDNKKKTKIVFIHHAPMWYRRPFFTLLNKEYVIEFLFTNVEGYDKLYGTELAHDLPGMESLNYKIVPKKGGIAWGAIKRLMGDYDIFVGGSWDNPADLIETMFYYVILKIKGKPFILWREDWDWDVNSIKRKLVKKIAGFISRGADALLVPSTKHQEFFTDLGVSSNKIFIMPNVSNIALQDVDYKNKDELIRELGLLNKKIVLFVGRLIELKGIQYLIPAFQKLSRKMSDIILLIVGDGEYREELEELTKNLHLSYKIKDKNNFSATENGIHPDKNNEEAIVIFTGNIDNKLLGAYYLLANIFVLPSITTYFADACPLVVNEAMYFGKPVISSDAVGTTFMIKNGKNGYVVPERDPDALFKAMDRILSDPELERHMGETSEEIIKHGFQYQDMMEGFEKALKHVKRKI
jgi:glycosyltransferase involved in cell wall biosynthesis